MIWVCMKYQGFLTDWSQVALIRILRLYWWSCILLAIPWKPNNTTKLLRDLRCNRRAVKRAWDRIRAEGRRAGTEPGWSASVAPLQPLQLTFFSALDFPWEGCLLLVASWRHFLSIVPSFQCSLERPSLPHLFSLWYYESHIMREGSVRGSFATLLRFVIFCIFCNSLSNMCDIFLWYWFAILWGLMMLVSFPVTVCYVYVIFRETSIQDLSLPVLIRLLWLCNHIVGVP